ncbi:nuclear pore complex protein Nup50 [Aricia agestis]|uniref:nuclear pore complex protein Nup50 n=1 Tax=Aricia agestis TaxID=91739 RepID=UPI001C20B080|nr:nuclear pore complex protein Nup50 [Aricia agestis]
MSIKRQATTELNHDNWDQEDPKEEDEDAGGFKIAAKDVLEKRVIRTAKRRSQIPGEESKKSVFSGFSGFNKTQPSSFDFLSNLTNGKNDNSSTPKSEKPMIFGTNNTNTSVSNTGLFGTPGEKTTKDSTALFGGNANKIGSGSPLFGNSQDSKHINPFSNQPTSSAFASFLPKTSETSTTQSSTNVFGANTTSKNSNSPMSNPSTTFGSSTSNLTPVKTNSTPTPPKSKQENDEIEDPKAKYYSKLKGLNVSVSDWIKQHVDKTPLCILSPIFKDYESYLKEIQEEYENSKSESKDKVESIISSTNTATSTNNTSSPFANSSKSLFTSSASSTFPTSGKPNFSFGTNTNSSTSNVPTGNSGIFGIKSPSGVVSTSTTVPSNGNAPFSFGIGKPFSFNSNIKSPEEPSAKTENEEDEDEPPKVEYTPVAEENSVYDKKCKIFVKKDENFVDKGVGTLYIKKIEESGKHQLLVRANTNLGNVLLNLILSSSLPTKRMGKNNVMMVCIPTPDFKPPPVPILIRVKTTEEADDLLSTLEKYKS